MRRLPFLLLSVTLPVTTFAQPDSTTFSNPTALGRGLISGSLSYRYGRSSANSQLVADAHYVNLSIARGWFIRDNWLLSVDASVSGSTNNVVAIPDFVQDGFSASLGGTIRRYLGQGRVRGFLGGGVTSGFNLQRSEAPRGGVVRGFRHHQQFLSVRPYTVLGALVLVTNRLGVQASASSDVFPFTFNNFGLGLVLLAGGEKLPGEGIAFISPTQKGRWLVGAGADVSAGRVNQFNRENNQTFRNDSRSRSLNIAPAIGLFIRDNWLLGVRVPFTRSMEQDFDENRRVVSSQLTLSPFVRHYVGNWRLRPFVDGAISYAMHWTNNSTESRFRTYGLRVAGGLAYLLNDRFMIEAILGNLAINRMSNARSAQWNIDASGSLSPGFTLNYVFR